MAKFYRFNCCLVALLFAASFANAQCPTLSSQSTDVSCGTNADGSIVLTVTGGTGPFTFEWIGPNGYTSPFQNIAGLGIGVYTVVVTSPGCSDTLTDTISQLPLVPVAITALDSTEFCPGDSVVLSATASGTDITYQWYIGNIAITGATDSSYAAMQSGNYTVVVSDTGFCPGTSAIIPVNVTPPPNTVLSPSGQVGVCIGDTLTIAAFNDTLYSYQWLNNGVIIPGEDSAMLQVTTAGNYQVLISELDACNALSDTVDVSINPLPIATISGITVSGTPKVVVTASFEEYAWYFNGQLLADSTEQHITLVGSGSYYVIVTDMNGCSDTSNILLIGVGNVGATAGTQAASIYPNPTTGYLLIDAPAKATITISDMQGRVLKRQTMQERLDIASFASGLYLVTMTDEEGDLLLKEKLLKQ